jgi:hypothetical protein
VPAIQSPNFVSGVSGWAIYANGTAEFNSVDINPGGTFMGADYVINEKGSFYYSATPALGNLVLSITPPGVGSVTDAFGNKAPTGFVTYLNSSVPLIALQVLQYTVACYTSPAAGSSWTPTGDYINVSPNQIVINSAAINVNGGPLVSEGGTPASPSLITTDTPTAMSLGNGWANQAGNVPCEYYLNAQGDTEIIGTLNGAAHTAAIFATLPTEYCPANNQAFWVGTNDTTARNIYGMCGTNGHLSIVGTLGAFAYPFNGTIKKRA